MNTYITRMKRKNEDLTKRKYLKYSNLRHTMIVISKNINDTVDILTNKGYDNITDETTNSTIIEI